MQGDSPRTAAYRNKVARTVSAALDDVAVVGGSSQIARFLVPRLIAAGRSVTVYSRSKPPWNLGVENVVAGLADLPAMLAAGRRTGVLVWLPPLLLLPEVLPGLGQAGIRRLIAFGTTASTYKARSQSQEDRDFARRTAEAEAALQEAGRRFDIAWTVLRPTMTYGCGHDDNVTNVSRLVRRFGCFPLAGAALGLRQPVHADDLAAACVAVLDAAVTHGKCYDLPGGETLSYRDMVARVGAVAGRRTFLIPLPVAVLSALIAVLRRSTRFRGLSPDMALRMQQDLCFDCVEARRDFGYSPGPFRLDAEALGLHVEAATDATPEAPCLPARRPSP